MQIYKWNLEKMKVFFSDIELPEQDRLLAHRLLYHTCIYDRVESNVIHYNIVLLSENIKNTEGHILYISNVSNRTFRVKGVNRSHLA